MKTIHLLIVLLFLFTGIYFAVFNWEVFIVGLNVSIGFSVIKIPFILSLFLLGFFLLLLQFGLVKLSELKHERDLIKKDNAMNSLKASLYDEQENEFQKIKASLDSINLKLESTAPGKDKKSGNKNQNLGVVEKKE